MARDRRESSVALSLIVAAAARTRGPDRLANALGMPIDGFLRSVSSAGAAAVAVGMVVRTLRGADATAAAGWAFVAVLASLASLAPWYIV